MEGEDSIDSPAGSSSVEGIPWPIGLMCYLVLRLVYQMVILTGIRKVKQMANIKTAISIQESLFKKIEELARKLGVPRSHIFVLAVEEFIEREENRRLLASINDAYKDEPEAVEQKLLRQMRSSHRRLVEGEW